MRLFPFGHIVCLCSVSLACCSSQAEYEWTMPAFNFYLRSNWDAVYKRHTDDLALFFGQMRRFGFTYCSCKNSAHQFSWWIMQAPCAGLQAICSISIQWVAWLQTFTTSVDLIDFFLNVRVESWPPSSPTSINTPWNPPEMYHAMHPSTASFVQRSRRFRRGLEKFLLVNIGCHMQFICWLLNLLFVSWCIWIHNGPNPSLCFQRKICCIFISTFFKNILSVCFSSAAFDRLCGGCK